MSVIGRVTTSILDNEIGKQSANIGLKRGEMIFQEARKLFVLLVELTGIEPVTS
jgi:hypothetical protein